MKVRVIRTATPALTAATDHDHRGCNDEGENATCRTILHGKRSRLGWHCNELGFVTEADRLRDDFIEGRLRVVKRHDVDG